MTRAPSGGRLGRRGFLTQPGPRPLPKNRHLVPTRPHSCGPRAGPLPPALIGGRPGLLQDRRSLTAYLPALPRRPARWAQSFSWKDYRDLIQTAHQQLGGPIVLVWDNLNTHLTTGMHRYIADRDWLTAFQLPPYAPT